MADWRVEYYETACGAIPVAEFLDELSDSEAARVTKAIDRLQKFGTALTPPFVRSMADSKLWELRVRGRIDHRVFYVAIRGRRIVLLHAFTKNSQRTPLRELRTAEQRLVDYEDRFGT